MRSEPGERVLFHGHPCWQSMLAFYVKGLLAAILAGVIAGLATMSAAGHVDTGWVAVGVIAIFGAVLLTGALRRAATTYTITTRRLVIEHGVVARDVQEARLDRVQNVLSRQTLRQRMMRVGSVHVDTAAGLGYDFCLSGVRDPRGLARTLDEALDRPLDPAPRAGSWV